MLLDKKQKEIALDVWNIYWESDKTYINANEEITSEEIDRRRLDIIPEINELIQGFLESKLDLEEFKSTIDSINKRHQLWGFKGINGQMFFNMLTNSSIQFDHRDELEEVLQKSLKAPSDVKAIKEKITTFQEFVEKVGEYHEDARKSPKIGSIPFYLSYFWQIQYPRQFPIYYFSMVNELKDLGIWSPMRNVVQDYSNFYKLSYELLDMYSRAANEELTLWDVEHAYWYHEKLDTTMGERDKAVAATVSAPIKGFLPESYIPPIVSTLPHLAKNDSEIRNLCEKSGRKTEKVFEERLAVLFRMLGYDVEELGQGSGRNPDGIARSPEYHYAILYDAKVRQDGYSMGTDERAIREYIKKLSNQLRRKGDKNIYFMVISSFFTGDHDDVIRTIKIETDASEIIFVEASALLVLLESKFRNPDLTLGPGGFQTILASSGLLTESDIRDIYGH